MKRFTCTVAILALVSSAASARGLSFGLKAGLFAANTTSVPAGMSNTSFKTGFAGGVAASYAFTDYFSLQPEVLYVMKGIDGSISNPYLTANLKGTYDYIEVPLLAKLTLATGSRVSPCVFFGPSLGINLKADIEGEYNSPMFHQQWTESSDYSTVTNKTEISLIFGAGLNCAVGPGAITLDGRFDLGLSNVTKGGDLSRQVNGVERIETVPASTSKNFGFALLVGYVF